MPDFNNKKEILRRLKAKKNSNKALWLPCTAAELCVKAWYAAACRLGLIFTDRNGRFLGVVQAGDKPKARRKDDIVYVKKPFFGRVLSAVLAAAFVMMFVPDLGISFNVAAADPPTIGITVIDENGKKIDAMIVSDYGAQPTYFINAAEYNAVRQNGNYKVTDIDYDVGYGAVRVTWKKPIMDAANSSIKLTGYDITLYQDGSKFDTNSEGDRKEYTIFEGLTVNNDTYAVITPKYSIRMLRYDGPLDKDNLPDQINVSYADDSKTYPRDGADCGDAGNSITPNARFNKPSFSILNSKGENIDSCTSADMVGGGVKLVWNKSLQIGGKSEDSDKPADGYVIYRYDVNNNSITSKEVVPSEGDGSITYTYKEKLTPGTHYQFFIEAFRYAWSDTEGFVKTQVDIISSSENHVKSDAMTKLGEYSDYTEDLYVAPVAPTLNIDDKDPKSKSIKISWTSSDGDYDGIELYRSVGEIIPNNIPEVASGQMTFSDWLKYHSDPSYKVIGVGKKDYKKPANSTVDTDVAEGVQYYYYAIPYTLKADGVTKIYGVPAWEVAKLEVSLFKTELSAKRGDGRVDLSWDPVDGADGYQLEITQLSEYDPITKKIVPIENPVAELKDVGSKTSYAHTELYNGEKYSYRVRPYIMIETQNGDKPYYGDYSNLRNITVGLVLDAPINVTADGLTDGQVTVKWDPVDGATGYILHSYNKTTGEKMEFNTGKTTYTQIDLNNDDLLEYYVVAYKDINSDFGDDVQRILSDESGHVTVRVGTALTTPQELKAVTTDGTINISWAAVPGAKGYLLHYKYIKKDGTSSDYTNETVFDVTKPTYTHSGLNNGDRYTYYVEAYKEVSGERVYSPKSDEAWAIVGVPLDAPKDLIGTTADGKIDLKWSESKGAEGYILHIIQNGIEVETIDVSKTNYSHVGLKNGEVYSYKVTAYKTVNGERVPSPDSNTITLTVGVPLNAPLDFTGTAGDGMVELEWTAVKGAEGYTLYFRRNGGAWQDIDLSKPGFEHIGLNNGDRYDYYVIAYKNVNGERVASAQSNVLSFTIGDLLEMPRDFNAVTTDGQVTLTWSTVKGAEGYVVYAYGNGRSYQFDVTKNSYVHSNLDNGDSWTYYVVAYKTVNGIRVYSSPTKSITVSIGVSLNSVIDLVATSGNRQVDLAWTAVKGAEGYVVYLYNSKTMEFEPITVISGTKYSHTGLKNGTKYTYMVAPYKTIGGTRYYGEYSMSVSATPSTGSNTDIDNTLTVRGTTPYGISHSEYIDASANHGAFDEPVDVYFTTNRESTEAVKDVLKNYADGLKSFIIYPFDISIYREGTREKVSPNSGYSVTVTMPIPDRLIAYRDYITVVHIGDGLEDTDNTDEITLNDASEDWIETDDGRLEVLPCAIVDIDNVWCVQFVCTNFSPYALVIYKEHITDVSASGGVIDGSFAGTFNSGVLLFTALPDIMPNDKRLKVVRGGKKRYRIKSVEKIDKQ